MQSAAQADSCQRDVNSGESEQRHSDECQQERSTPLVAPHQQVSPEDTIAETLKREANDLYYYTGSPDADDNVLFAVCVCAPRSAIDRHKYTVELSFGNEKRGAAAKEIVHHFQSVAKLHLQYHCAAPAEVAAVDLMDIQEATRQLIGSFRLRTPKLASIEQSLKRTHTGDGAPSLCSEQASEGSMPSFSPQ
jgi:hypothetical protein